MRAVTAGLAAAAVLVVLALTTGTWRDGNLTEPLDARIRSACEDHAVAGSGTRDDAVAECIAELEAMDPDTAEWWIETGLPSVSAEFGGG